MEELGFVVNRFYGLTETYAAGERFIVKARQGEPHLCIEEVDVRDSITMKKVPTDGVTMVEVIFRGNTVMSGYLKDQKATEEAFRGGCFRVVILPSNILMATRSERSFER
ncbi:hypothetical protein FXO38_00749 [Capsicum annuum]|nr:hypothetical protein FXO38_00749 [Capsicum annuum]